MTSASPRNNPWPKPHNPEHLFTKALLAHGPIPGKGWSLTRGVNGKVIYVRVHGRPAKIFQKDVTDMFAGEVKRVYSPRRWSEWHCQQIGKSWKNLFFLWLWDQIDDE